MGAGTIKRREVNALTLFPYMVSLRAERGNLRIEKKIEREESSPLAKLIREPERKGLSLTQEPLKLKNLEGGSQS